MFDDYRFLDPWTLMLPEETGSLLAVSGSGGKSTLLRRLHDHYVAAGKTVLWTQTVDHPAPFGLPRATSLDQVRDTLRTETSVFLAGPGEEIAAGLEDATIQDARDLADIILVEAHARTQTPLRRDAIAPVWPTRAQALFLVGQIGAVGRPWSPSTVAGAKEASREPGQEPRRVRSEDLLDSYLDPRDGWLSAVPERGLVVPFLSGMASYRDMDGMFALVSRLWEHPRVQVVCLAELLGDPRRDTADLRDLPETGGAILSGERVYALYPASLDDE